jgi:hypothetical protein
MKWQWALVPLLLLAAGRLFAPATIGCTVDDDYNRYVGVAFVNPPGQGVVPASLTARVVTPAQTARAGLAGARAGDTVVFRNHYNGYWTVQLERTGQSVKLPLFYEAVCGFRPDRELADREIPGEVTGRVTDPAILRRLGFPAATTGDRVALELAGTKATHLRLVASGERRALP